MSNEITLSINPSYLCNMRCSFCYLSDDQLSDPKVINNDKLIELLSDISSKRIISHVDLYGGEVAMIKTHELNKIINTIHLFYSSQINIISNLTIIHPSFLDEKITLSVSWDYFAREHFQKVYENMKSLKKNFHVLVLASRKLIEMNENDFQEMIRLLNDLPYLASVEIKPFSDNQFHGDNITHLEFESWIQRWILQKKNFKFEFINIKKIQDSLNSVYSSWSDEHLYITPRGKLSVLDFDENNKEYFLELNEFDDYLKWSEKEKYKVTKNEFCGKCTYLGRCLSEHLQPVYSLENSCNGFKGLLDWYQSLEGN